jgi:CBS domain-containing protein
MKIDELLRKKGRQGVTVTRHATIFEVVRLLRLHRIGCVDGKHVEGLVAVRDVAYAMAERADRLRSALGADILDARIERIMTHEVHCCGKQDSLRQVMDEMTRRHILHVPVLEDGALCGIVSTEGVVRYAVEEMDLEKEVLQDSVLMLRTPDDMR